jgi:hypothetical protein|tara:strand:- start:13409 stop:13828 length:420 start_codon:yes stop_codon:yes gene_type:complete
MGDMGCNGLLWQFNRKDKIMGFFSWITQDTNKSINNIHCNKPMFNVTMTNPINGQKWTESNYDGYGVFGGKDYYKLLAEINGKTSRDEGLAIAFDTEIELKNKMKIIWPTLTEDRNAKVKGKPENCPEQGYFYDDCIEW